MKYLSVCSGIEAATVAWHGLGWRPVAFAEIEAFPAAVLAHHYPTVPNLGDMTKYREWPEELLADVDLLVGGTPCQAFSVAGLRRSLDDERGNLSLTYVNLFHHINEVRKRHGRSPAIALWENVPGVLSTKDNAFGCFIGGLLGCDEAPETEKGKWDKAGFISSETVRVGYRVLDAQYFGVAQRRRRVFLAAVPCELVERFGERACPSEILSLRESVLGNPPPRGAAWEGFARTTAAGLTSSGRGVAGTLDSNYHKGCGERAGVEREVVIDSPHPCIDANIDAKWGCDQWVNGGYGILSPKSVEGVSKTLVAGKQQRLDSETETFVVEGHPDPAYAISAGQQGTLDTTRPSRGGGQAVAFKPGQSSSSRPLGEGDEVCCTLEGAANGNAGHKVAIQRAMQVRRLCPSECEALQGFPIGYTDVTYRKKPACDGPRYRALGNSMAVPCMWWLGYRIQKATD